MTVSVAGNVKVFFRGKYYRPGDVFEVEDYAYNELKLSMDIVPTEKPEPEEKPVKKVIKEKAEGV